MWSVLSCYNQDSWNSEFSCQLSSAWEAVKIGPQRVFAAVPRERLVKTQQAGKGLAAAVVICEFWRLAVAL
jgi:hypothetical protein